MDMRVFIVKIPEHFHDGEWVAKINPIEAEQFGTVKIILGSGRMLLNEEVPILEEALGDFTKDDYLVLMGSPIQMGLASYFAMRQAKGNVKFLTWDNFKKKYYLQEVSCGKKD